MKVYVVLEQEHYGSSKILSIHSTEGGAFRRLLDLLKDRKYTKGTRENSWDVVGQMRGYRIEDHCLKD